MYFVEVAKNLIQPGYQIKKQQNVTKTSLSLSHFNFYSVKKPVFYYKSVHLTGQTALLRSSAKA